MVFACELCMEIPYDRIAVNVQMSALGHQDGALTRDPEVSFLKSSPLMHTSFALVQGENEFDHPRPRFSDDASLVNPVYRCTIEKKSHVIVALYLEALVSDNSGSGYDLIEEVSLSIGGTEIERMSGEWMSCRSLLAVTDEKRDGFAEMTSGSAMVLPLPFGVTTSLMSSGIPVLPAYNRELTFSLKLKPGLLTRPRPRFRILTEEALLTNAECRTLYLSAPRTQLFLQSREHSESIEPGRDSLRIQANFNALCRRIIVMLRDSSGSVVPCLQSARLFINGIDVMPSGPKTLTGERVDSFYLDTVGACLRKGDRPIRGMYVFSFSISNPMEPTGLFKSHFPLKASPPVSDIHSPWADQPCGAFDMSPTTNFIELRLSPGHVAREVHVIAECYNFIEYSSGVVRVVYVN